MNKSLLISISILLVFSELCLGQEQFFTIQKDSIDGHGWLSPTFNSFPFKEKKPARLEWNSDTLFGIVKKCLLLKLTREELKELSEMESCYTLFDLGTDRRAHNCQFLVDSMTAQNVNQKLFYNLYQALTTCLFPFSEKDVVIVKTKDYNSIFTGFPIVSKKRSFLIWE